MKHEKILVYRKAESFNLYHPYSLSLLEDPSGRVARLDLELQVVPQILVCPEEI